MFDFVVLIGVSVVAIAALLFALCGIVYVPPFHVLLTQHVFAKKEKDHTGLKLRHAGLHWLNCLYERTVPVFSSDFVDMREFQLD